MNYLDLTLPTPAENLALDEALLLEAEAGRAGEILRVWELPSYAVVLGSACRLTDDVMEENCQADGVPILRRCSGGGTVLLGPGCLCFSLVLSFERPGMQDVTHSYTFIMERLCQALATPNFAVERVGGSDLAVANRKFSGNAQRRMRSFALHHGTILNEFDLPRIERYLKLPTRQPAYREGREHEAFLLNLPLAGAELQERLQMAWQAIEATTDYPVDVLSRLAMEKYRRDDWTRRR